MFNEFYIRRSIEGQVPEMNVKTNKAMLPRLFIVVNLPPPQQIVFHIPNEALTCGAIFLSTYVIRSDPVMKV